MGTFLMSLHLWISLTSQPCSISQFSDVPPLSHFRSSRSSLLILCLYSISILDHLLISLCITYPGQFYLSCVTCSITTTNQIHVFLNNTLVINFTFHGVCYFKFRDIVCFTRDHSCQTDSLTYFYRHITSFWYYFVAQIKIALNFFQLLSFSNMLILRMSDIDLC